MLMLLELTKIGTNRISIVLTGKTTSLQKPATLKAEAEMDEDEDDYDEGEPEIEGSRLHDVVWMMVDATSLVLATYSTLVKDPL